MTGSRGSRGPRGPKNAWQFYVFGKYINVENIYGKLYMEIYVWNIIFGILYYIYYMCVDRWRDKQIALEQCCDVAALQAPTLNKIDVFLTIRFNYNELSDVSMLSISVTFLLIEFSLLVEAARNYWRIVSLGFLFDQVFIIS